jgi:hypothetical protein
MYSTAERRIVQGNGGGDLLTTRCSGRGDSDGSQLNGQVGGLA